MSAEVPQPLDGVEFALLLAQIVQVLGLRFSYASYALQRLCRRRATG